MFDQHTLPGSSPCSEAIADFGLMAFYYLLRVGEYTHKRRKGTTCIIQFRMQDVAFKNVTSLLLMMHPCWNF